MNKTMKVIFLTSLLVIGACIGIFIGISIERNNKLNDNLKDDSIQNDNIAVFNDLKKEENLEVIKECYYKECKHTIVSKENQYTPDIKSLKDQYIQGNLDYTVKEDYSNKLILYKEIEDICMHHYTLKENDKGTIDVYVLENNNLKLYETINIPVNKLQKDMQNELKIGMKVETLEKLNSMIENMES